MSCIWTADQSDNAPDSDSRDYRAMQFSCSKTSAKNKSTPTLRNYDSSLRNMLETSIEPSIANDYVSLDVSGRHIPLGFAAYVEPNINPLNYNFYYIPGWTIAIPRAIPMNQVNNILNMILYQGPESVGYIRMGDTMVPAVLSPGDRMSLAQAAR